MKTRNFGRNSVLLTGLWLNNEVVVYRYCFTVKTFFIMTVNLLFFYIHANQPTEPHFRAKILLNFAHANEAR